jgi:16S rRNA G1207 methylase RsmC
MAIQSAQANFKNYFPEATPEESEFHWTNCFENPKPSLIDLVLCNPPFHQGNTMGDFIAWQMFTDSHRALVPGGMIRVIGNSHLKYHQTLKRIFGNSKIVASNNKFTIVDADK